MRQRTRLYKLATEVKHIASSLKVGENWHDTWVKIKNDLPGIDEKNSSFSAWPWETYIQTTNGWALSLDEMSEDTGGLPTVEIRRVGHTGPDAAEFECLHRNYDDIVRFVSKPA